MYTKDLASLLNLLSVSEQSGILHVEPPTEEHVGEPWHALIQLVGGEVRLCQVQRVKDGQVLLLNNDAMRWLASLGGLSWSLEETSKQLPVLPLSLPQGVRPPRKNDEATTEPIRQIDKQRVSGSSARREWTLEMVPRRTAKGEQAQMHPSWSRDHRIIFALVDGHKTIAAIAALLHKSPLLIGHVLTDFQSIGLLE